ncbi:MAG: hypothetical protein ABSD38_12855 [Syntrophorhabdales bacterium]|jgi:hypothetical protein
MAYPFPEGEELRRAVKWVAAGLRESPGQQVGRLVEQAIFKFDLSPKDGEYLLNFFRSGGAASGGDS